MMVKSFGIVRRKPSLTPGEYERYWKESHGPLAAKVIPGLRKYIQNHGIKMPGLEIDIDGISEIWWDNIEALQNYLTWRQTEDAKVLIEDEKKFIDTSRTQRFFAVEHVVVEKLL
jgi:uncharacterized protein (TIGR02118 family)